MAAVLLVTLQSAQPGACANAADCHLNGDCVGGRCACDSQWSASPDCSTMAFALQDKAARPGYYNATESSWGGNPVQDKDGKYHLFHAQMLNGCGLGSWTSNSVVARSTAKTLNGPYSFEEVAVPAFAHNPTVRVESDGSYTVYENPPPRRRHSSLA